MPTTCTTCTNLQNALAHAHNVCQHLYFTQLLIEHQLTEHPPAPCPVCEKLQYQIDHAKRYPSRECRDLNRQLIAHMEPMHQTPHTGPRLPWEYWPAVSPLIESILERNN